MNLILYSIDIEHGLQQATVQRSHCRPDKLRQIKVCGGPDLWPFPRQFDYIVLICPTFAHNKTYHQIGENDPRMFVIICVQHEVELWLKLVSCFFEGANTLIILDDCAASKDVKGRTGQLVNLGQVFLLAILASAFGC